MPTPPLLEDLQLMDRISQAILREFTKCVLDNVFYRNLDYLLETAANVAFDKDNWIYKPELFCHDYYGNQYVYPVVLLCNGISSIYEFTPKCIPSILAPEYARIIHLAKKILI